MVMGPSASHFSFERGANKHHSEHGIIHLALSHSRLLNKMETSAAVLSSWPLTSYNLVVVIQKKLGNLVIFLSDLMRDVTSLKTTSAVEVLINSS